MQWIEEFVSNPKARRLYGLAEKWHDSAIQIPAVLPAIFPTLPRSLNLGVSKDFQRKTRLGDYERITSAFDSSALADGAPPPSSSATSAPLRFVPSHSTFLQKHTGLGGPSGQPRPVAPGFASLPKNPKRKGMNRRESAGVIPASRDQSRSTRIRRRRSSISAPRPPSSALRASGTGTSEMLLLVPVP